MKESPLKLMLITNKQDRSLDEYLDFVALCAETGITSVQLREKNLTVDELIRFGKALQSVLKPFSIPLIVNDNLELAEQLDAAGVHLGQSDGSVIKAREKLGNNKLIGLTIETPEQLHIANEFPIDYIGISSIFPSQNKLDITTLWGCDGLQKAASIAKHPIIAIGGINEINAAAVVNAGADGIAAIGLFHDTLDPRTTIQNLRHLRQLER